MRKHKFYLDFYRGLAIVLMFITHTFRLLNKGGGFEQEGVLGAFYLFFIQIEPFTSASFLFISGYSLSFALKRKDIKDILKRIGEIYIFSFLLYIFSKGFHYQMFYNSTILTTICFSLLLIILISKLNKKYLGISILTITIFSLYFLYKIQGTIEIPLLITGAGPILPLFLFALWGYYLAEEKSIKLPLFLGLIGFLISGNYIFITTEITNNYNSIAGFLTNNAVSVSKAKHWIHSYQGFLRNLFFIILFISIIKRYNNIIMKDKLAQVFSKLGKVSLFSYIMHLSIIGIFYKFKIYPQNNIQGLLFIFILVLLSLGYFRFKETS